MRNITKAFTLLEMLVVVMIVMLLATMITGVYIKEVERARVATAASDIREMALAAERYKIDMGSYPDADPLLADGSGFGTGTFHSVAVFKPAGATNWNGPYINIQKDRLTTGSTVQDYQILDPWGTPYSYLPSSAYETGPGSKIQDGPFVGNYYNQNGVQIYSCGPNGVTLDGFERGLDSDDISNFSM